MIRAALLVLTLTLAPAALAQAPRAADGHPDFGGIWISRWMTPLERPPEAKALIVPAADAPALREILYKRFDAVDPLDPTSGQDVTTLLPIDGEFRSSLVIDPADGKLPFTPEGKARREKFRPFTGADGPEQRGLNERCVTGGNGAPPMLTAPAGNIRQIVQTKDHLMIWTELFSQTRIVRLDGRPSAPEPRMGHANARWEADTLVIETDGVTDPARAVRLSVMLMTPQTRITERFKFSGADELRYSYTVEDKLLYTRPWTAETVMKRSADPMFEFACHEYNYGLAGILSGARAVEQRAAKKAKP